MQAIDIDTVDELIGQFFIHQRDEFAFIRFLVQAWITHCACLYGDTMLRRPVFRISARGNVLGVSLANLGLSRRSCHLVVNQSNVAVMPCIIRHQVPSAD